MRFKTSRTLRSIDSWKQRFDLRNHRFLAVMSILVLAASYSNGEIFLLALIILALSIHYAAIQLAVLMLIGFLAVKLGMYRFTNVLLRGLSLGRTLTR